MKSCNLLLLLIFTSTCCFAQPPFQWATQLGSAAGGDDLATCVRTDNAGNTFVCGTFKGTIDMDPTAVVYNITSVGSTDEFVAKYSPTGNLLWAFGIGGPYDDKEPDLVVDQLGDVYVTGATGGDTDFDPSAATAVVGFITGSSSYGMFLAKYSSAGALIFAKRTSTIAGYGSNIPYALAIDNSNNLLVTGWFQVSCDFDLNATSLNVVAPANSNGSMFVAKYNSSGAVQWANAFGGTQGCQGTAIAADVSGNAIIGGSFTGSGSFGANSLTALSSQDMVLMKLNSSGTGQWAKRIGNATYNNQFNSIATDGSGNIYGTGAFYYTTDFDPGAGVNNLVSAGSLDIFLAKYDAAGNYLWAKSTGRQSNDIGVSVCLDASNNIYLTGECVDTLDADMNAGTAYVNTDPNLYYGIFMAKYDENGNYLNAKSISSNYSLYNRSGCIDASGNIRIAGGLGNLSEADFNPDTAVVYNLGTPNQYGYNLYVGSYTNSGIFQWAHSSEDAYDFGYDEVKSVAVDASGNTYVTGYFGGIMDVDPSAVVNNLTYAGFYDVFIAKYAPSGALVWAKSIGSSRSEIGTGIALDAQNNIYVCGEFEALDSVDFDPGAGVFIMKANNDYDGFMLKLDNNGNFVWAKQITGTAYEEPSSIKLDGAGNIYLAGLYSGTADFDPSAGTSPQTSVNNYEDIFFAKYNSSGTIIWSRGIGSSGIDYITGLAIDGNGSVIVSGYESNALIDFDPGVGLVVPNSGIYNGFVAQYDAGGNYLWVNLFYNSGFVSQAYGVDVDAANNIYVVGKYENPSTSFGGINGGGASGYEKIYLAKFNSSGTGQWVKQMGDVAGRKAGTQIDVDAAGNAYVGGYFNSTINFGAATLTPLANQDCFYGKRNSSGINQWVYSTEGISDETLTCVATDAAGNMVVGGNFLGSCDFNPTAGVATLSSKANSDGFFLRLGTCPTPPAPTNTTANSTICNGASAQLSASGSGILGWYSAMSGGTYLGGGNNFTTATLTGNTTFYAQDSTCGGVSARTPIAVTVNSTITVGANATATQVCTGGQTTLTGTGATTYAWNNGVTDGTSFTPASTNTYTVTGTELGCTATATVSVTVNPIPTVGTTATASTLCTGEQTTLTGTGATTYAWNNGVTDGTSFTPASTNTYTVTGTELGCTATATVSVTVNPIPTVGVTATATTLCAGEQTTLTGTGATTYAWNNVVTDGAPFTPASTNTYTVTGTELGCSATASILITVNSPSTVSITSTRDTICIGEVTTLVANGSLNYLWSTTAQNDSISISPNTTSAFSVTATDINNCSSTATKELAVYDAVDISTTVSGFTITANAANAIYQWRNCTTNTNVVGANSQSYTVTANGDYEVQVIAATGCVDTSACVNITGVGVNEILENVISVSPNPFNNQFVVSFSALEETYVMEIYSALGQLVKREKISAPTQTVLLNEQSSGVYLLRIISNETIFEKKLVKL